MRSIRCAVAALVGALVALVAPMVVAEVQGPIASVVHADRLTPRVAEEGNIRMVPLTEGERGFLGEFSLKAGAEVEPKVREEEEYLYVLTGSAILSVDDESFLVGPRVAVYLPEGAEVSWTNGSQRLVALQFLAGATPGSEYESWRVDDDQVVWPRPRVFPRPRPTGVSMK